MEWKNISPSAERAGERKLYLKLENLQPIGAFKLRGAYNKVASLSAQERRRGVISYSSGNHGQGVAYAARALGARAIIVMPDNAPKNKISATAALGAEIVFVGPGSEERRLRAEQLAAEHGYAIVPPYDDQKIIANAKWAASLMAKKIVSDYQGSFGVITRQDIVTAQVACGRFAVTSQHDFVVLYILGCLWSGHAAVAKPPLSLSRMVSAKDLAALLPAMPPNGSQVVTDVSIYLSILKKVSRFLIKSPLGFR